MRKYKYGTPVTADRKKYHKNYRKEKIAQGFCGACWSRSVVEGKVTCTICLDKRREKSILIKNEVLQHYGKRCACCGETEIAFLTIDHTENNGQEERTLYGEGSSFYRWLKTNKFPENGYQVLCFNCNCGRRVNGGICPHERDKW